MVIISSQHYINPEIVESKMEELSGVNCVSIPCWDAGVIDGKEYAVQNDKHHTLAAAREMGLQIKYVISDDPEGLCGLDLLDARYNDGDYYDVENSNPLYDDFNFIW